MDVELDVTTYLRPGDTVLIGQGLAEPPGLVTQFIQAAQRIEGLTAVCGYTLSDAWLAVQPGHPTVKGYMGHGSMRALSRRGLLDALPCHYSSIEGLIRRGDMPVDVVLLQVGPCDDAGRFTLGPTVDYVVDAAKFARVVLVEVNERMPRTQASRSLPRALVTAETTAATKLLPGSPTRPPTKTEHRVASNVASLIPDGATIQLGVGALADAIASGLRRRGGLTVRSGLVSDWLVTLDHAGALDRTPGSTVVGMAVGTERLYALVETSPAVRFAPMQDIVAPAALREIAAYFAINSAIEVDLYGQSNAEVVNRHYVGAVGGQVDYFRAARLSIDGAAILALASTHNDGSSRVVPSLTGLVTTPKSDIDYVVTEWGAAHIAACSLSERTSRLTQVAHPNHRDWLREAPPFFEYLGRQL